MTQNTQTSQTGSDMTYKWNSIWYAELFTPAGRLATKVKFRMNKGDTPQDVLDRIEDFKAGRERTFTLSGVCSMTKRKLACPTKL